MLRLRRTLLLTIAVIATAWTCATAQSVALKTNTLYWLAGGTANASLEFAASQKVTIDVLGAYNPWTFKDDKKMRMWGVQPEVKYWFCEKFEGHFVGIHAHGGEFFGGFNKYRYDGHFIGGGLSYGYDWILSPHWNLEAEIGLGYAYLWYKRSERIPCEKCSEKQHKNYLGPTKAAISLVYIF